jgi:hypothetical protein
MHFERGRGRSVTLNRSHCRWLRQIEELEPEGSAGRSSIYGPSRRRRPRGNQSVVQYGLTATPVQRWVDGSRRRPNEIVEVVSGGR